MSLVWLGLIAGCGDDATRTVTRIAIDPGAPKVPAGIAIDLAATYVAADLSTSIADDVTWQVADTGIAKVTPETGGHAKLLGVMTGTTMLTVSGTRGVAEAFMVTVTPALLMTISIAPPQPSIAAGTSTDLIATGTYSDSSNMDLTTVVAWASSAEDVATVSDVGALAGLVPGTATITASFQAVTGTVNATVTDALLRSIQVTPLDPSRPKGVDTQFTATGLFSDSSHQDITHNNGVVWSSDADAIASVDPATGAATLHLAGAATITATKGGISGSSHLTVTDAVLKSIAIAPPTPSAPAGLTLKLTATGTFTDGPQVLTTQVNWSSDDDQIASVGPDTGEVAAHAKGTAKITATSKAHPEISASVDFAVTDAVVQAIVVSSDLLTIAPRTTTQFKAAAMLSDGTTIPDVTAQATWDSDHQDVATVANATTDTTTKGEATGVAGGDAQISAAFGGKTGTATLHVTNGVLQSIAVTAPSQTDQSALSIPNGQKLQFQAIGTFVDATDPDHPTTATQDLTRQAALTWTSSQPTIADISNVRPNQGEATALSPGTTKITATFGTGADAVPGNDVTLTVTEVVSIAIDPLDASVPAGRHRQFKAIATLTDGTTPDVTAQVEWSSSDDTIASIVATGPGAGDATAVAADPGPVTITATFHQASHDVTQTTTLTVLAAVLDAIEIDPPTATFAVAGTQRFTARGTFSDGTHSDLTDAVWSCDKTDIATIVADTGVATGVSAGGATITAMSGDVAGHATITVSAPPPPDFAVSEVTPADGVEGIVLNPEIKVTFNRPIDPTTLTAQAGPGPCTGSLQLSPDPDFVTCLGFAADSPTMSVDNAVASARPTGPLLSLTTYKVRVLATVTDADHTPLASVFTQLHGFTTVEASVHAGVARR